MKNFWISWNHRESYGAFTLETPWWVSGRAGDDSYDIICAAVCAADENEAREQILRTYDKRPTTRHFVWRFASERPRDWQPFCDRFPKADWMKWGSTTSSSGFSDIP
jgi:hypothetical protein